VNSQITIGPHFRVVLPEAAAICIVQVGVGRCGSWLAMSLARIVYHARRTRFVLVGAVDNHLARRELAEAASLGDGRVWAIDAGNAR
jgi:hypothetical protein